MRDNPAVTAAAAESKSVSIEVDDPSGVVDDDNDDDDNDDLIVLNTKAICTSC